MVGLEEIKEDTQLCLREYDYFGKSYNWSFAKVKKITPSGKIRLDNGKLLKDLGSYKVYNDSMRSLHIEDLIDKSMLHIIYKLYVSKGYLIKGLSTDKLIDIFNFISNLSLEELEWANPQEKEDFIFCTNRMKAYIESREELK